MRLSEALMAARKPWPAAVPDYKVFLACGFTPLHLETFLVARLRAALPDHRITVATGLYGDALGNLERLAQAEADAAALALEWSDLDARLGLRSLGGWRQTEFADISGSVCSRLKRIAELLQAASSRMPVAVSLPTLPPLPLQPTAPAWKGGAWQLEMDALVSSFAANAAANPAVRIVSPTWLDQISPPAQRFDAKSELLDGFPYTLPHAAALSEVITRLLEPPPPKKGLITDLDDTLWRGILGEIGPGQISWDLHHNSHMFAVYQELLASLAQSGVLLAVASKNHLPLVEEAFARADLRLSKESIFPFEIHWGRKSESVSRILKVWNVAPDSVVFVDNSPAELAEVRAGHPEIECLQFPATPQELYSFVTRIRNLFAKPAISREDRIRLGSIRRGNMVPVNGEMSGSDPDAFLKQAEALLSFHLEASANDPRVLELINKTNQFNLNGRRYTEHGLGRYLADPGAFVLKADYTDKFGPLGTIAILLGRKDGKRAQIDTWVMSCRAFSRRIEHACLDYLIRRFELDELSFDFLSTPRNQPLQEFFGHWQADPQPGLRLSKEQFYGKCPPLFQAVSEETHG